MLNILWYLLYSGEPIAKRSLRLLIPINVIVIIKDIRNKAESIKRPINSPLFMPSFVAATTGAIVLHMPIKNMK